MAVAPPDVSTALFALSQEKGLPVLRGGMRIPGRMPGEAAATDRQAADYLLVVRFAVILPPLAEVPAGTWSAGLAAEARLVAAAVGGVDPLGFGGGGPAGPRPGSYGTPGGYRRGYEGAAPNDFWHRDTDFFARDYLLRNSPPAPTASPPAGLSSAPERVRGAAPLAGARGTGAVSAGLYVLELECYPLAGFGPDKTPRPLWRAVVRRKADDRGLAAALPGMAEAAWSRKEERSPE
jgi:hypothetical protein